MNQIVFETCDSWSIKFLLYFLSNNLLLEEIFKHFTILHINLNSIITSSRGNFFTFIFHYHQRFFQIVCKSNEQKSYNRDASSNNTELSPFCIHFFIPNQATVLNENLRSFIDALIIWIIVLIYSTLMESIIVHR